MAGPVTAVDGALTALLALSLSVPVLDERPPSSDPLTDFVLVGDDGEPGRVDTESASSALSRAAFEDDTRDETGIITLAVVSNSGASETGDLAACRAASLAVLTELVAAIAVDPTLGGSVADCWVSGIDLFQGRNSLGVYARRVVGLAFEALQ